MKTRVLTLIIAFTLSNSTYSQCDFNEDYSNTNGWTQIGSEVEIINGQLNFINGAAGSFGSVNGTFFLNDNQNCEQNRKIPIIDFHGTADSFVPYDVNFEGDYSPDGAMLFNENLAYWMEFNGLTDITVESIPGPTALIAGIVSSGLPTDRFLFEGFLPPKKGRQTRLQLLAQETRTIIFYESPHKLIKTLGQIIEFFEADRPVSVSREITKLHEETIRGTLQEVIDYFSQKPIKGEIVIVVQGNTK